MNRKTNDLKSAKAEGNTRGYRRLMLYCYDFLSLLIVDIFLIGVGTSTDIDYGSVTF